MELLGNLAIANYGTEIKAKGRLSNSQYGRPDDRDRASNQK